MEQINLLSIIGRKETHPSLPPGRKQQQQNKLKHENKETKQNQEKEFYKELVYKRMSV